MAQNTPLVRGDTLLYQQDKQDYVLAVGTPDWFTWLTTASTFAFTSESGTFTARKERAGNKRGGWFWKAYRKRGGKLTSAYLGKSEKLTVERLNTIAALLAREGGLTTDETGKAVPVGDDTVPEQVRADQREAQVYNRIEVWSEPVGQKVANSEEALFGTPILCPVLIGRAADLTALHSLIDQAKRGEGRVALISGEAGIGKSRLLAEVRTEAPRLDFLFLQGNCFQADHLFPYAPLIDLLRTYIQTHAAAAAADLQPLASELPRLLPDLPLLLPQLAPIAVLPALDPEQEKHRLFAVLLHFFTRQAEHHPTLIMIEDIHWCDETSLEFLLHLAHRCSQIPLLLLCTYRSDESSLPLQHFQAELHRERLAQQITLLPLSRDEVGAMLNAMAFQGASLPADVWDTLYPLTEGNPFFIEELLSTSLTMAQARVQEEAGSHREYSGAHGHFPIPHSVQDAVLRRTEHVSPEARHALVLAAVAGRRFNFAVLQHVLGYDEAHLLELMKELIAAQLVVEESAEQFAFRHALTRQAIYEGLLARERKALHRTIAEALESLAPTSALRDASLADLAAHCYAAEMWEKALAYGQLLGEKAMALDAPRAAVAHITEALGAAHQLAMTPPAVLHRVRGQGYDTLGEFERAQADYEQALRLARLSGDRLMEWQCLLDLGSLWTGRDYAQAGTWFRQALALAEQLASPDAACAQSEPPG